MNHTTVPPPDQATGDDDGLLPFERELLTYPLSAEEVRRLLVPGAVFDTEFETGCVVITAPGSEDPFLPNNFAALDHEGIECEYFVVMVTKVNGETTR